MSDDPHRPDGPEPDAPPDEQSEQTPPVDDYRLTPPPSPPPEYSGSDVSPRPEEFRQAPAYPPVLKPMSDRPRKRSRNPIDRLTHRLPRPWRIAIDWVVTIAGAIAIVLAIKQWVVNPYRIPSSSMEPTLH